MWNCKIKSYFSNIKAVFLNIIEFLNISYFILNTNFEREFNFNKKYSTQELISKFD